MSSTSQNPSQAAHDSIATQAPSVEQQEHVAFVLNLHNDTICHVYNIPGEGLCLDPIPSPSSILLSAANYARSFPKQDGEDFLRDLAPYAAPFIQAFNEGAEAARLHHERQAQARAEALLPVTIDETKQAEMMETLPGKKNALSWLSKRASDMIKERRAKKANSDALSVKTARTTKTLLGLKSSKKAGKDSDAMSVMTTTSFFAKGGDWCKTKTKKTSGAGAVKRLTQSFFFSMNRTSSPKSSPTDIRAEYLARSSSSTSTSSTASKVAPSSVTTTISSPTALSTAATTVESPFPRDPSTLSVSVNARETLVSGPDWSRVDNWDDCTIEAMFMNERYADNNILGGPMFE